MSLFKRDAHNFWMDYQSMIEMTNTFTPLDETIYMQHCPMAD